MKELEDKDQRRRAELNQVQREVDLAEQNHQRLLHLRDQLLDDRQKC